MATSRWVMPDPPETGVFVTRPLWDDHEPLLGLRHHDDGDWSFWGLTEPTDDNAGDLLMLVHLRHVVERFPEVQQFAGLPRDRSAFRASPGEEFLEGE